METFGPIDYSAIYFFLDSKVLFELKMMKISKNMKVILLNTNLFNKK